MRKWCFIQYLVKASIERRRISTVHQFYLCSQIIKTKLSSTEETVADTKVLVFSLLRSFILTPFDFAIVNRKQRSFFERRKRCTLKR